MDKPVAGPSRKPNMSLFSLFSRPKVQKLRGYAESGLATPVKHDEMSSSRMDLNDLPLPDPPRAPSSMSFRTHRTSNSGTTISRHPARRPSEEHRSTSHWNPLPLFQALARSTKHGLVEVSTASPETVFAKSRAKRIGALHLPAESSPRTSAETSRSGEKLGRFASKASGSVSAHAGATHVELERKIFVLVSTGHLVQYAEYGPSGRLPEKVLQLGEASAAFASDLIGGRPHVAHVSQAVDAQGLPVAAGAAGGGLFSKVGIKSAGDKMRMSDVLIVLPDGDELNLWLGAVRRLIEELGGAKSSGEVGADSHSRNVSTSDAGVSGRDEPAPMQRYHIKRRSESVGPSNLRETEISVSPIEPPKIAEPKSEVNASPKKSLDEDEAFAEKLAAGASYTKPGSVRDRRTSDAQSVNSSVAQSVDHLRLNSLRNSVRMSTNTNVTGWTSRTNSLTSEHAAPNKQSLESPTETYSSRGPYRNLSSYNSGKRRSAMPSSAPLARAPSGASIDTAITSTLPPKVPESGEDSPVVGYNAAPLTALPPIAPPRGKILSSRQSMPLLTASMSKTENTTPKLPPPPPISEAGERPQSFVADLPSSTPSTHWTSKLVSPAKRSSTIQPFPPVASTPTDRKPHRMSSAPALQTTAATTTNPRTTAARRNSSQPFSLPLKVNPSGSHTSASWQSSRRPSPSAIKPVQQPSLPRTHTLEAQIATPRPSSENNSNTQTAARKTSNPQRLSIFPPAAPAAPAATTTPTINPSPVEQSQAQTQTQRNHLKRPISIQIRSSPAPFLSGRPAPSPQVAGVGGNGRNNVRARASLPVLDLGIPVVGLGPPAPPPGGPLPEVPTAGAGAGGRRGVGAELR